MFTVPHSSIPLLVDPPFVILLLLLATSIGYSVLKLIGTPIRSVDQWEKGVFSLAAGLGLLQFLPYALGMAGPLFGIPLLRPVTLYIGIGVLGVLQHRNMWRVLRQIILSVRRVKYNRAYLSLIAIFAIFLLLTVIRSLTVSPFGNDDGYHLTAPKRWLQAGGLVGLPSMTLTMAPSGVEMLYTIALGVWSDTSTRLLAWSMGIVSVSAVFLLGRRFKSEAVGLSATILYLLGLPKFNMIYYISEANVDVGVVLQVCCMALALLFWIRTKEAKWAIAAALFAGFASSFKLTGVFAGISLLVVVVSEGCRAHDRNIWKLSTVVLICLLIPIVPWLFRSWLQTGNPVYPALPRVFPSRDWGVEHGAIFDTFFKYYNWGKVLGGSMSVGQKALLCNVLRMGVLLGTILAALKIKAPEMRAIVIFWLIDAACIISVTGLYPRYFLPITSMIYIVLLSALARTAAVERVLVYATTASLALVTAGSLLNARYTLVRDTGFITGVVSREAYLKSDDTGYYDTWEFINHNINPNEPILAAAFHPSLALGSGCTFIGNNSCYVTDAYFQNTIRMNTWQNYLQDIQRRGIHYVISVRTLGYGHYGPQYAAADNEYPFSRRLVADHGTQLFHSGVFELYELNWDASAKDRVSLNSAHGYVH